MTIVVGMLAPRKYLYPSYSRVTYSFFDRAFLYNSVSKRLALRGWMNGECVL